MPLRKTSDKTVNNKKRTYRFLGTPNDEQKEQLNITLGHCRYLYNRMLADKKDMYEYFGDDLLRTPAWYKHISDCTWLKQADSSALANVQINLSTAFNNFFAGRANYPAFKKKSRHRDSYTTNMTENNIKFRIKKGDGYLVLPKVPGEIKIVVHRPVEKGGHIKHVTVVHEPDDRYYFSILFEYDEEMKAAEKKKDPRTIGLDMTMHGLYKDSNGESVDYPSFYRKAESRIAKAQKKLSRMEKGSNNYEKQRQYIARLYAKTKHQRSDMLHKISRQLVDTYDLIGIEDLDMRAMSQSLNFGKSVGDKGWGMFTTMLQYKATNAGKTVIKVDKMFPSSRTCHECGALTKITKDLSVREWTCPACGHHHDRDTNVAMNIRDEALRIYMAI